jgi:hypothetical protein
VLLSQTFQCRICVELYFCFGVFCSVLYAFLQLLYNFSEDKENKNKFETQMPIADVMRNARVRSCQF